MHLFLNNIYIINKYMHIFDISIVINTQNNMIFKLILSGFYLPKTIINIYDIKPMFSTWLGEVKYYNLHSLNRRPCILGFDIT